ncbi:MULTISPECIES: sucrase ferredoxin [unclassified Corynebacterium]|uniref:sucrase ferredoxin n=1 Tax=unclassified Corynebacterium TaxID=2624378 RepID=UPI0029CA19ED|nr:MULTISPECIES: sucrase ferredoxin [unclassified Corynebacterium]WPF66569.1 sucrase ferredoxin [Corynebacterium sp. 22KM0430]WPF69058.1 sucrase ferredoxin [Corynebacterium sp. 21KM1197]
MASTLTRDAPLCSDVRSDPHGEPLAGTAKRGEVYVLFEWPGGWSRDVLDGGTFGPELSARLKRFFKGTASLQLIRRPGRAGRDVGHKHRCYLVWARTARMELVLLDAPEDLLRLDLTGPGRNGGEEITAPVVLVCTHGRRDRCCAIKGRPLAARLQEEFPGSLIWESSHTKGHRFAPAVLLMPWGYSFGHLNIEAARDLTRHALDGRYFYPANRGSGLYGSRGQVAELHVARMLIDAGETLHYGDLTTDDAPEGSVAVRHRDGRAWAVPLTRRTVEGVVASCGGSPKAAKVWVPDLSGDEEPA